MNCPKCGFNLEHLASLSKSTLETMLADELGLSAKKKRADGSHFYHDFGFSGHKYRLVEALQIVLKLKAKKGK